MRKPSLLIVRAALATIGASLSLSSANAQSYGYYPVVHETFDLNTTGTLVGQDAKGYGLSGKYAAFGSADANAFQVMAGGIPFSPLNSTAGNALKVSTETAGVGIGALLDGGKTFGYDTTTDFYNNLYVSYLIQFSSVTTSVGGRALVRINNSATAGGTTFRFQASADSGAANLQPAVAYNDTPLTLGTAGSLANNTPYLIIGKFTNVGNTLSATATGTGSLYALTQAQYTSFRTSSNPANYLTSAAIGSASNQITVRLNTTTPITAGNFAFGHGRAMQILAQGLGGSAQTFLIDEIRYGDTLRSVAYTTAVHPTGPAAQAADNFTIGPSEGYPDGGTGWKSNWYEVAENSTTSGAYGTADSSATPFPSSGSFLQVYNYASGSADQGIRRRPDPAYVNMSQPYTVKFDFRGDTGFLTPAASGGSSAPFSTYNDRIHIGADSDGTAVGTSATLSWLVGVVGADQSASNPFYAGNWYFYNDAPAGTAGVTSGAFVKGNMTDTGVPLIESHVFRFVIEVDPPNKRYKATVTNLNTNATFTQANLRFRNQTVDSTTLLFGTVKSAAELRFFGLDNIALQQGIPDPYLTWLDSFPAITQAADKLRTADFDKDDRKNFLEYAIDGNPASPTNDGKLVPVIKDVGGTNYYTLTIPVRTDVAFSGTTGPRVSNIVDLLQYRIEGSYDMVNFNADVIEIPAPTSGLQPLSTNPGYVYKSFRLGASVAAQPKGFLRAVIINQ